MKIILLRDNLVAGLGTIERAVGASSNLPILKNVLLTVKESGVVLTATNLELAVTREVSGKVLEVGEATFPFGIFNSIVKNISAERITLTRSGKKLVITSDNYEAQIQTQDPKEFPLIPKVQESASTARFTAAGIADALQSVIVAAQYTDLRPEISGVLFRCAEDSVTFVATDSFRLAEYVLKGRGAEKALDAIIPLRAAEEALRIAAAAPRENEVLVSIDQNQALFEIPQTNIVSRLIDGRFPEYQAIIPKEIKNEITVEREELIRGVKLTSAFAGRANDITIALSENRKTIELSSSDAALGENRYQISVKAKGEKISAIFNWKYLIDGLKIYRGETINFGINAPDRPAIIRDASAPHLTYVVMPIKG